MPERESKSATPRPITAQPLTRNEFEKCSKWLEGIAESLGFLVGFAGANDPWRALQVFRDCVDAANYVHSAPNWFAPRVWLILQQYDEPGDVMSMCGETAPNAHNLAFRLAPKMAGVIIAADPQALDHVAAMKPRSGHLMTKDTWPKAKWQAVRKAVLRFPTFDAQSLALRIKAERQRCLTRWASEDQAGENPDIPNPDETLVLKIRGKGRAILRYLWKRGPTSREDLRQAIWEKKRITDRGIDKAIDDLNLRLSIIIGTGCKTKVVRNGGMYLLQHPQK